jgi:hypothetical protein
MMTLRYEHVFKTNPGAISAYRLDAYVASPMRLSQLAERYASILEPTEEYHILVIELTPARVNLLLAPRGNPGMNFPLLHLPDFLNAG